MAPGGGLQDARQELAAWTAGKLVADVRALGIKRARSMKRSRGGTARSRAASIQNGWHTRRWPA